MAGGPEIKATLSFLTDAAHLLAASSPEISAYLMSRRNDLMFENEIPTTDKRREQVCACCGHILLLGDGDSHMEIRPDKHYRLRQKKKTKSGFASVKQPRLGPTKVITCGHCSRVTNIQLPPPPPASRPKVKKTPGKPGVAAKSAQGALSTTTKPETASPKPTSSSASSKKRAKSRKAGLQALLSQTSSASKPGLGLSLADFLDKK
jgi:hypothetical protein